MTSAASWTPPTPAVPRGDWVDASRLRAIATLFSYLPDTVEKRLDVARDVEEHIHRVCDVQNTDYGAKVLQLAWNLRVNATKLLLEHNLDEIVLLDDAALANGTAADEWWREHHRRLDKQSKLLYEDAKFEEEEQSTHSELICSRCHSRSIGIQQQQTRSADEGMTVFCTCKQCGLRWKMY